MKIYHFSGSAHVWRVLLACVVKDVPFELVSVPPTQEGLKSPEFLQLNPRGKVPVLQDGDFTLAESMASVAYIDRKAGGPSIFGETPDEHGLIWRRVLDFDLYVSQRMLTGIILPILFGRTATEASEIKAASARCHEELTLLERDLATRMWFEGERISAADIAVYPFVEVVLRFTGRPEAAELSLGFDGFAERYPNLERWRQGIMALPGYDKSYPEYWRQLDAGGI